MPPSFVLIPGAGGDAWYWHLVERELRQRGRDVVSVQLPATDDRAGLSEYVETVVRAAGDRTNVVLVAQSMAGFSAPQVATRLPTSLLVLVNAMIPAPGDTPGAWWDNTGQAEARRAKDVREGRDPNAEFDPFTVFLHDVPRDVVEESATHVSPQSGTPFGCRWPLEAWPDVPTRVIVGRDDRFFPAEFQRRVAQERLGITPDELPGGHLIALSHPKELVEQLQRYAAAQRVG